MCSEFKHGAIPSCHHFVIQTENTSHHNRPVSCVFLRFLVDLSSSHYVPSSIPALSPYPFVFYAINTDIK